jgi:hypothetical protein
VGGARFRGLYYQGSVALGVFAGIDVLEDALHRSHLQVTLDLLDLALIDLEGFPIVVHQGGIAGRAIEDDHIRFRTQEEFADLFAVRTFDVKGFHIRS